MSTTADIPTILRSAGLTVVVESTWDLLPLGAFPIDNPKIVWHHDASPVGPSPGALDWITSSYRAGDPSAQLWVDTAGVWHCVGKGLAYHAGKTADGTANNHDSIGIETDHTTGETWPDALLTSLRRGTTALLLAFGRSAFSGLWFHKDIAVPAGRKQDPDGLDITAERTRVAALMAVPAAPSTPSTPTPPTVPEDDMYNDADRKRDNEMAAQVKYLKDQFSDFPEDGNGQRSLSRLLSAILDRLQVLTKGK